jgi:hypothetical protein
VIEELKNLLRYDNDRELSSYDECLSTNPLEETPLKVCKLRRNPEE